MTQNQKAVQQLIDNSVNAKEDNDSVYVYCGDTLIEISDFEIRFRANLYDTHLIEL